MICRRVLGHSAACWLALTTLSVAQALGQGGEIVRDLSPFRSCGLNCLFVIARLNDRPISLASLEKVLAPSEEGESSIAGLERAASSIGLHPISVKADFASLAELPLPAIVHLKSRSAQSTASHYVVLLGLHERGVMTIDPPSGTTLHPYDEFANDWTGVAISFLPDRARQDELLSRYVGLAEPSFWPKWLAVVVVSLIAACILLMRGRRPRSRQDKPFAEI